MHTILLVDDDESLREALAESFVDEGDFETIEAATFAQGQASAGDSRFDIALLDVSLPDGDGRQLARWMRAQGYKQPIVMLTGNTSEEDELEGLSSGATDYVRKPFKWPMLLARVRAHLDQHARSDAGSFMCGDLTFEGETRRILLPSGKSIKLTDKEAGILRHLARSPDRQASREDLLGSVWGYNPSVTTHTLETHIYRLRQKIEARPAEPVILLTQDGGYALAPGA